MSRMELAIRRIIKELVDDYKRSPLSYLTETDVVASLASRLRKALPNESVHTGLCPTRGTQEMIVGKSKEFDVATRGCAVDIAILNRKSVESTVNKNKEKKYWRYLRFPVEDLKAAMEVKVRVVGNKGRILDDVKKLTTIGEENEYCLLCLVILDRKARRRQIEEILKEAEEKNVQVHFYVRNCSS